VRIVVGHHQEVRAAGGICVAGELVDEPPPDVGGRLAGRHYPYLPGRGRGPERGDGGAEDQSHGVVARRQPGEVGGGEGGDVAGRDARVLAQPGDPGWPDRAVFTGPAAGGPAAAGVAGEEHRDSPVLGRQRHRGVIGQSRLLSDHQQRPPEPGRRRVLAGNPQAAEGCGRALVTDGERHRLTRRKVTEIRGRLAAGPQVVDGEREHEQVCGLVGRHDRPDQGPGHLAVGLAQVG